MRIFALLIFTLVTHLSSAGELPWIGVSLRPPTSEQRENSSLNHGVGFFVGQVITGGPLAKAGGKEGDLWWKLDGQILINMGQMVVLLRGKSPGEVVEIEFFRGSQLQKLKLELATRRRQNIIPVSMIEDRPSGLRVLSKREQVARITVEKQELSLQSEGDQWRFEIKEGDDIVLSSLTGDQDLSDKVPAKWHGAFVILRQTLKNSGSSAGTPLKRRARYVPGPKSPAE